MSPCVHENPTKALLDGHILSAGGQPVGRAVELSLHSPRLVIVDPLYLAAAGGKGSDLYAMGEVLTGVQQLCQEAGAALVVTHHWNKTGTGTGIDRMTGVGPTAWGRVLGSGAVTRTATGENERSEVEVEWEFVGSEIPGAEFTMTRRVWFDDPRSLSAPLHYEVEVATGLRHMEVKAERVKQQMDALLEFLREHPRSSKTAVEKKLGRWARDLLRTARAAGLADFELGARKAQLWSAS